MIKHQLFRSILSILSSYVVISPPSLFHHRRRGPSSPPHRLQHHCLSDPPHPPPLLWRQSITPTSGHLRSSSLTNMVFPWCLWFTPKSWWDSFCSGPPMRDPLGGCQCHLENRSVCERERERGKNEESLLPWYMSCYFNSSVSHHNCPGNRQKWSEKKENSLATWTG